MIMITSLIFFLLLFLPAAGYGQPADAGKPGDFAVDAGTMVDSVQPAQSDSFERYTVWDYLRGRRPPADQWKKKKTTLFLGWVLLLIFGMLVIGALIIGRQIQHKKE